jgi:hypothetical protein
MRQSRKKLNLLSLLEKNSNADTKKSKKGYQMMAFIFSFIHTSGRVLITFFCTKEMQKK